MSYQNIIINKGKSVEIDLFGEIGGFFGVNNKVDFINQVKESEAKDIIINISSPGGSVDDALAMHDFLKGFNGNVTANLTGIVASAATLVALGANKINMSDNALFMIHKPLSGIDIWGWYNEDDIETLKNDLDHTKIVNTKVKDRIINVYAKKTGLEIGDIDEMLTAETWMDAQEAQELGFVDNITDAVKVAAQLDEKHLNEFINAPKDKLKDFIKSKEMNKINEEKLADTLFDKLKAWMSPKEETSVKIEVTDDVKTFVKDQIKELTSDIDSKDSEITELKSSIEGKDAEIEALKSEKEQLEAKLEGRETPVQGGDPNPAEGRKVEKGVFDFIAQICNERVKNN